MDVKKTIKVDGKLKGVRIINHALMTEDGEIINLIGLLESVYGDSAFDIGTTTKTEEIIDPTPDEEIDASELEP